MTDSTDTARYAVVGNPISHSLSPVIHGHFARETGEAISYERIEAPVDGFAETVRGFFNGGGCGLNVTVPFKQQAWELVDQRSARAESAGAVNTLWRDEQQRLCGDNTDGVGLVRDLERNHGVPLKGRRVLILGAGGAVRGIMEPLIDAAPGEIVIANRTLARAEELAERFSGPVPVTAVAFDQASEAFDLIINGTSASLQGDLPPLADSLVTPDTACYDMMYSAETTVFNRWAGERGARRTMDGLGMLVEQAAESFRIWRGVLPETMPVIEALRRRD